MDVFLIDKIKDARWFVHVKDAAGRPRKIKAVEKSILLQVAINKKSDLDAIGLMAKSSIKDHVIHANYYSSETIVKSEGKELCEVLERSRKMFKAELARVCGISFRRIMQYVDGMVKIGALKEDKNGYLTIPGNISTLIGPTHKVEDRVSVRARA